VARRHLDKDQSFLNEDAVSRVTSKLQVTVPKVIAERYGIRPGDEIDWVPAGDAIRVVPPARRIPSSKDGRALRVALFDRATERQRERQQVQTRRGDVSIVGGAARI
jgi:AbrB family looped-hinge helix DNA binding protein